MPFDKLALFRDGATNLAGTETSTAIDTGRYTARPLMVEVVVPQAAGTNPTLDIAVQHSDDGTTYAALRSFPQITAPGVYRLPIVSERRYLRAVFTVDGTGANFGRVVAGLKPVGGMNTV